MGLNKETVLKDNAFLVSETDSKGNIIFANEEFCSIAEYELNDLIGKPHNIIRHDDMPKAAFKDLWETVKNNKVWQGFVKNKTKSGGFYWVCATIYPYKNEKGEQCFMSCRRKPPQGEITKYEALYKTMQ
ncbi:PAS domain-containing protein [Arcobacter sp. F2176]|uniref:PAS domain-containing protein n=1 Tax=unclassified Arcobacter TaxID=2593671 RepID=UPI00100A850E|nr:PAS domain-containing protein [Arcobacter sp. F2176]RXJ82561.1 PAS sensor domain-containing protein [Arcobacter sp. F2176]